MDKQKVLVVEEPRQDIRLYELSSKSLKKFGLDEGDLETMRNGEIVWRDGVAYTVEDPEEHSGSEMIVSDWNDEVIE